jgi:SHS2 domain-containing protein
MYRYQILDHPADIKLKIEADTLEDLFKGSAIALSEILVQEEDIDYRIKIEEKISLSSYDLNALLVDFLSEILAISDIKNAVFKEIFIEKLLDNEISAIIKGYPVKRFNKEIKAVTYHQLEIKKVDDLYQAIILFDI